MAGGSTGGHRPRCGPIDVGPALIDEGAPDLRRRSVRPEGLEPPTLGLGVVGEQSRLVHESLFVQVAGTFGSIAVQAG